MVPSKKVAPPSRRLTPELVEGACRAGKMPALPSLLSLNPCWPRRQLPRCTRIEFAQDAGACCG